MRLPQPFCIYCRLPCHASQQPQQVPGSCLLTHLAQRPHQVCHPYCWIRGESLHGTDAFCTWGKTPEDQHLSIIEFAQIITLGTRAEAEGPSAQVILRLEKKAVILNTEKLLTHTEGRRERERERERTVILRPKAHRQELFFTSIFASLLLLALVAPSLKVAPLGSPHSPWWPPAPSPA